MYSVKSINIISNSVVIILKIDILTLQIVKINFGII